MKTVYRPNPNNKGAIVKHMAETAPLKHLPETASDVLRSIRSDERAIATYQAGIAQKRQRLASWQAT